MSVLAVLSRRRFATTKFVAQESTEILILDGIRNYRHLNAKCCAAQAAWRGSIARGRHHRVGEHSPLLEFVS